SGTSGARTAAPRPTASSGAEVEVSGDRVDVVLARIQIPHAEGALVVGLCRTGRDELARPLRVLITHDPHRRAGHRFAELVVDMPGDDAAAWQSEVDTA